MSGYVLALVAMTDVTGLGLALQQLVQTNPIAFLLYVPPILLTATNGGLRPSLFATIVGGLAAEYFFRFPYFTLPKAWDEIVPLTLYLVIGTGISVLSDRLARARQDVQRREREFETLNMIGPPAKSAATELIRLAHDRDESVRTAANEALKKVAASASPDQK